MNSTQGSMLTVFLFLRELKQVSLFSNLKDVYQERF